MRRWCLRIALVFLAASAVAGALLGEIAVQRGGPAGIDAQSRARAETVAREHGASIVPVRLTADDGVTLEAWHFTRQSPAHGTVLVVHGTGGSRDHATPYVAFLLDAGFDVVAPDARGHGESGGLPTYGVREAGDVRRWASHIQARRPGRCIYAIGSSMGAAHVLLAEGAAPTFCAIVSDSAFATFLDAGLDRIAARLGVGDAGRWLGRPAAYAALGHVRLRHGVRLEDAAPIHTIGRIAAPILLIHGDADRDTPPYHAAALAGAAPRATLWLVPGARHTAAWRAAPTEFPRRIVAFFRQHG